MSRVALLASVLACALALAAPAQAGIVSDEDAAELAQTLAEAQEEQDVCYGWNVTNNFSPTSDVGSSTGGPGVPLAPTQAACPKGAVILEGDIDYACGSCESSDSASVSISSGNLANPPTVKDLEGLGLNAGDLTGDNDDTTLVNMVNALPLLVADRGNAPYVEYEQATTVPAADHATDKPGSDLLRDSWLGLLFFGGLILAGPGFFFYKRSQQPKRSAPAPGADLAARPDAPAQAEPWPGQGEPEPPSSESAPPPQPPRDPMVDPFTDVTHGRRPPAPAPAPEPDPPAEPDPPRKPSTPPPAT